MNEARKAIGRPKAASAPRILVVEDESDLALLLTYNLEAEGYLVERVERGDEAELRLAENAPDLVILDWMLPGVSGLEICRRLRAREATRSLPVIMVTARGEEGERVRGLSVGADDYVVKPFSVPSLRRDKAVIRRMSINDPACAQKKRSPTGPLQILGHPAQGQRRVRGGDRGRAVGLHEAARPRPSAGLSGRDVQATRRRKPLAEAVRPGSPARVDYEYTRNGVANLFMMFAPLEGWHHVKVTDRRTAIDYAPF